MDQKEWIDVVEELNSNIDGLSKEQAKERLDKNGRNVLPKEKKDSIIKIFFGELFAPLEVILLITVIISFFIGETVDALVILFIILVDVIMGSYQEYKALKSAEALSNILKIKTKVLRDGAELEIDSEELVVGDILIVDSGTKITSDARIIESYNLQVDESVLTGESTTVAKTNTVITEEVALAERKNMLYAGTNVMTGRAKAIVVATSIHTEIGKITKSILDTEDEKSPLTIRVEKFSKQITVLIGIVALVSGILLYIKGYEVKAIFLSVVALAVSAMPEGLSLALTMALTIASNRMSKQNVIVKKLNSVESLGSCTIIASDKTGTLTANEQTARKIVLKNGDTFDISGTGYNTKGDITTKIENSMDLAKRLALLCAYNNEAHFEEASDQYEWYGDSIDIAFLVLKEKMKIKEQIKVVSMIPYESEKQYSAIFYEENGILRCTVKGSLEKIMEFSEKKDLYQKQNEELSKEGYRVIAVCDGCVDGTKEKNIHSLEFLGLVAFIDPVREEAVSSIKECHQAGIKVVMITGDHPLTAFKIGKDLNLVTKMEEVATGTEIEGAYAKGEEYFQKFIQKKYVFSRVTPMDKLHIVDAYKKMGEFVAVTGDGVNDAPALKTANIGVSMGSGTDVAKDTADMIITDDNFKFIVTAVLEGRIAYSNIRKITLFLLSCGMAEVLFYLLSIGFNYPLPLLAIQLLWLNVVTDGLQDFALSFERETKNIMKEKPRSPKENLFNKGLMMEVLLFGVVIALMVFNTWKYLMDNKVDLFLSRSMIMLLMVFIQNIHVLNCRSEKNSVFTTKLTSNPLVICTIIGTIFLQLFVTMMPIGEKFLGITHVSFEHIFILFLVSLIVIVASEIYKYFYRKRIGGTTC